MNQKNVHKNHPKNNIATLVIQDYINKEKIQYPSYYQEIATTAKHLGKFSRNRKLIIGMLCHTAEQSITSTLELYTQQSIDQELFELFLFLNRRPHDPLFNRLENEINQFKRSNPKVNISYCKKTFQKNITYGYLRKYVDDTILMRSSDPHLVHVVNDADVEYMQRDYLQELYSQFQKNPFGICYRIPDIPPWIKEYPMFHKLLTLYRLVDYEYNAYAHKNLFIRLYENYSFPSDLYVMNDGFSALTSIGEDLTFAYNACLIFSKEIFHKTSAIFYCSIRRYLIAYLEHKPLYASHTDFWTHDIRSIKIKKLLILLKDKEKRVSAIYFQNEIQMFFNYFIKYRILQYLDQDNERISSNEAAEIATKIFTSALNKMDYAFRVASYADNKHTIELSPTGKD